MKLIWFHSSPKARKKIDKAINHPPLWAWSFKYGGLHAVNEEEWEYIKRLREVRPAEITPKYHISWGGAYKKKDYVTK